MVAIWMTLGLIAGLAVVAIFELPFVIAVLVVVMGMLAGEMIGDYLQNRFS